MSKLHWENLNKEERALYMMYQMSGDGQGGHSAFLPDDCVMCVICSTPTLGHQFCNSCSNEFDKLDEKLRA